MLHNRVFVPALLAAALTCGPASVAHAYVQRVGATTLALLSPVRGHDVAFDSTNKVYLVVSTMGQVRGRFVAADGTPVGTAFVIQASLNYTHFPRVAFSPDADNGAGAFLVTWHESDQPSGTSVHARLVSYTRGGPFGADTGYNTLPLGVGSKWEAGAAVAYSTRSKEFLVAWQTVANDITLARVNNAAGLVARTTLATADGERDPSVAYNPTTDHFLVVYTGWGDIGAFAQARLVAAATDRIGAPVLLGTSSGTYITDVSYSSATDQFLAAWYAPTASYGRLVNANGTASGNVLTLSARWKAYDGLGLAFNAHSNSFFLVSHSDTAEDGGVELQANGVPVDNGFLVTAAGGTGNYYPRIAAATDRPDWLVSTAHDFKSTLVQRLSGVAGEAPPPPPPACAFTVSPTSATVGSNANSGSLKVTTTEGCAWTASSSASWLTLAVASGTGSGTVTFSVGANPLPQPRTAAITIAGQSVGITQRAGLSAVHDISGDARSDLMWHNQSTGHIALWTLSGNTVIGTAWLNNGNPVDKSWKLKGTGDLNGDGFADLLWRHLDGRLAAWFMQKGAVVSTSALLNATDPNVEVAPATQTDPAWQVRAVADLNGDTRADLVWQNDVDGRLAVWFMNGATVTRFAALSTASVGDLNWKIVGAADINADGMADILWQHLGTGALAGWLMNGTTVVLTQRLSHSVSDLDWRVRGVGDTNFDGFADLLWQNIVTGQVAVWYLNGFNASYMALLSIDRVADTSWVVVGPS